MDIDIITKQDLMEFNEQFFQELYKFLKNLSSSRFSKVALSLFS